ncbi:MAG: hypothetical protein PUB97_08885 [Ruminococcus sp.]|nr:hypothetical protein [Ruminococcus sp.]
MARLDFVKKLYNGKNCYSDHMSEEDLNLLHISSGVEKNIIEMLYKQKIIFLTGNPGDGKTYIIKAISKDIEDTNAYVETDMNNISSYTKIIEDIIECYHSKRPAIIAVNEYPFFQLCKKIKKSYPEIHSEIIAAKKSVITYNISAPLTGRFAIVDLNERNLLDADHNLLENLTKRFIDLLSEDEHIGASLQYNINALSTPEIRAQFLYLFKLVSAECKHFAVRDILGAFSFIFTACTTEEFEGEKYYSAIFNGNNQLLKEVQQFDPIYLSSPDIDEQLWNGEITEGWILDVPTEWPNSIRFEEEPELAVECFKNIKRKYYFENIQGYKLKELQPDEITKCIDIFNSFDSQKKKIKERLIRSLNKLFLPSSDDRKQLRIWTTHRYDMSIPANVAISRKYIDSSELDIEMPRPSDWLNGMEYIPNHIIMKPKGKQEPRLLLDVDFLRTLNAIEDGYPISLLAPQYEQAVAMFLQQLEDNEITEENDDGEIILASRRKSYYKSVNIQDGKYSFEED